MDNIRRGARVSKTVFFLSAAVAFAGLGVYLTGHEAPGILALILGLAGVIISFAVLRVALMSEAVISNRKSKANKENREKKV